MVRVAACLVTRGNVDLTEILESLPEEWEQVVWDNSKRVDFGVYGRYAAIELTDAEFIYVQDDDCVLEPEAFTWLLAGVRPEAIVANMPERFRHDFYRNHCLVGFGAIFHRDLPGRAFKRFNDYYGDSVAGEWFLRTSDVVFTTLTPRRLVDVSHRDLPWASDPDRMWKQPEHQGERTRMLEYARRVVQ